MSFHSLLKYKFIQKKQRCFIFSYLLAVWIQRCKMYRSVKQLLHCTQSEGDAMTTHGETKRLTLANRQIRGRSCFCWWGWDLDPASGRNETDRVFFLSHSLFLKRITFKYKNKPAQRCFFIWGPVISFEISCWNKENLWAQWKVASCGVKQALVCHRVNTSGSLEGDWRDVWYKCPAEPGSGSSITVAVIAMI